MATADVDEEGVGACHGGLRVLADLARSRGLHLPSHAVASGGANLSKDLIDTLLKSMYNNGSRFSVRVKKE